MRGRKQRLRGAFAPAWNRAYCAPGQCTSPPWTPLTRLWQRGWGSVCSARSCLCPPCPKHCGGQTAGDLPVVRTPHTLLPGGHSCH